MPGAAFVGWRQYAALGSDAGLRNSLVNTALYVAIVAPVSIGGALGGGAPPGAGPPAPLFQTVFFLPVTATLVAMATAWEVVLHPSFGIANTALSGWASSACAS